ncbi:Hypothetical predicted protein [Cloeon dipterum]|uniref:Beta-hexosaminidase n=1 Tax=Cloeon dipterum TaxID=197152 RepID=A0A8S1BZ75_9INSE|nr:Hypothetical predicted protein [Cloeon dipterum]
MIFYKISGSSREAVSFHAIRAIHMALKRFALLLIASAVFHFAASGAANGSPWVWWCHQGNCARTGRDEAVALIGSRFDSHDECSLLCSQSAGPLWPKPTGQVTLKNSLRLINANAITFISIQASLLEQMQNVFRETVNLMACDRPTSCPAQEEPTGDTLEVKITVEDPTIGHLEWGTDESYSLKMDSGTTEGGAVTAEIRAATVFGARHGLETLAQLMTKGGSDSGFFYLLSGAEIVNDKPAFTHRGISLDTARHFISLPAIKRTLDVMGRCKLNVLHLHLTDSHSFPLVSKAVPELSTWGAYSDAETYTLEQLAELSAYAMARGVRLIPELDAPAHAGQGWQWGPEKGMGELAVCVGQQPWRQLCIQPPCGQLNPANQNVYAILGQLYKEMLEAFAPHADTVFHMGGDEVFLECWKQANNVTDWLATQRTQRPLSDHDYMWAWQYFQAKALRELDQAYNQTNKKPPSVILWSSQLTEPESIASTLDPARYVIQTWVPANETLNQDLISRGYRIIVSIKDAWYLDHGFWGITKYANWKKVYEARVPKEALGGEVALWSELIDERSMDAILWPRSASLAERLWSNPSSSSGALRRLLRWTRTIYKYRAIQASAITPQWCEMHEAECD